MTTQTKEHQVTIAVKAGIGAGGQELTTLIANALRDAGISVTVSGLIDPVRLSILNSITDSVHVDVVYEQRHRAEM